MYSKKSYDLMFYSEVITLKMSKQNQVVKAEILTLTVRNKKHRQATSSQTAHYRVYFNDFGKYQFTTLAGKSTI